MKNLLQILSVSCLLLPFAGKASAQALTDGNVYQLVSKYSGKCLDVTNRATNEGAGLQQWSCTGQANQRFRAHHIGYGLIVLRPLSAPDKCLSFRDAEKTWDGARVILRTECSGYSNAFVIEATGSNTIRMKSTGSNSTKCLDIAGPSRYDGAVAQQWACTGGDNQNWIPVL